MKHDNDSTFLVLSCPDAEEPQDQSPGTSSIADSGNVEDEAVISTRTTDEEEQTRSDDTLERPSNAHGNTTSSSAELAEKATMLYSEREHSRKEVRQEDSGSTEFFRREIIGCGSDDKAEKMKAYTYECRKIDDVAKATDRFVNLQSEVPKSRFQPILDEVDSESTDTEEYSFINWASILT